MRDVRSKALLVTIALTIAGGLIIANMGDEFDTSVPNLPPPADPQQAFIPSLAGETPRRFSSIDTTLGDQSSAKKTDPRSLTDIRPLPDKSQQALAAHAQEKAAAETQQKFQHGVAMLQAKRHQEAITAFHRVLQLAPALPEAHVNMGFALLGLARHAAARDFFAEAIKLNKHQINAYYGLALAQHGLNNLPAAIGAMRTYQHLIPADDPYRVRAEALLKDWEAQQVDSGGVAPVTKQ